MHEHRLLSCLLVAGIPAIAKTNSRTETHHGAIELDVIVISATRALCRSLPYRRCPADDKSSQGCSGSHF
jgi:hypothetical protein